MHDVSGWMHANKNNVRHLFYLTRWLWQRHLYCSNVWSVSYVILIRSRLLSVCTKSLFSVCVVCEKCGIRTPDRRRGLPLTNVACKYFEPIRPHYGLHRDVDRNRDKHLKWETGCPVESSCRARVRSPILSVHCVLPTDAQILTQIFEEKRTKIFHEIMRRERLERPCRSLKIFVRLVGFKNWWQFRW